MTTFGKVFVRFGFWQKKNWGCSCTKKNVARQAEVSSQSLRPFGGDDQQLLAMVSQDGQTVLLPLFSHFSSKGLLN